MIPEPKVIHAFCQTKDTHEAHPSYLKSLKINQGFFTVRTLRPSFSCKEWIITGADFSGVSYFCKIFNPLSLLLLSTENQLGNDTANSHQVKENSLS